MTSILDSRSRRDEYLPQCDIRYSGSNYKSSGDNGLTASGNKVSFAVSAIRDRTQKDSGKAGITATVQSEIDRGRVNKMIHTQRGVI